MPDLGQSEDWAHGMDSWKAAPVLIDLCCGAGGAAKGYYEAGFRPIGIDINPQPNYPFEFIQADALVALDCLLGGRSGDLPLLERVAGFHASPPCQFKTAYRRRPDHVAESPNLIPLIRKQLVRTRVPYVIENVEGARDHLRNPIMLCGTGFGLNVQRHRYFESNFPLMSPGCSHGRYGARFPAATNRAENSRRTIEVGVWRIPLYKQQRAMEIDWMTLEELSQAIPPAYTEHIGHYLMAEIRARAAA